jgi:hypothetical protein
MGGPGSGRRPGGGKGLPANHKRPTPKLVGYSKTAKKNAMNPVALKNAEKSRMRKLSAIRKRQGK